MAGASPKQPEFERDDTMTQTGFLFLVLLAAPPAPALAAGKFALLDLTGERDQQTRAADRLVLERLEKLLAERTGCSPAVLEGKFSEPPDPAWRELELSARQSLESAEQLFYALKPARALEELNRALSSLRSAFPGLKDFSLLARVHLMLGVTHFSTGEKALAAQHFRQVLLLEPKMVLDDTRFNPLLVETFEKLRQLVQTENRSVVSVISQPAQAAVTIDGKYAGVTPVTVSGLLAGEHYLQVSREGYRTWFAVLKLAPGAELRQEVFLQAGESMNLVRHIKRLEGSSLSAADAEDIKPLLNALEVNWLVLAALRRLGGDTQLELAVAAPPDGQPTLLGIFGVSQKDMETAVGIFASWLRGEPVTGRMAQPPPRTTSTSLPGGPSIPPAPLTPAAPAWYKTWWFWSAVGVLVAGTAATVTVLALDRPSGYRIDIIR
jgi:hypothetical protein